MQCIAEFWDLCKHNDILAVTSLCSTPLQRLQFPLQLGTTWEPGEILWGLHWFPTFAHCHWVLPLGSTWLSWQTAWSVLWHDVAWNKMWESVPHLATCAKTRKLVSISEHHIQFISSSNWISMAPGWEGRSLDIFLQGEGGACFELLHNSDDVDLIWPQQIKMCSLVRAWWNLWLVKIAIQVFKCCPTLGEYAHFMWLVLRFLDCWCWCSWEYHGSDGDTPSYL